MTEKVSQQVLDLHHAALTGNVDLVKRLLDSGVNVDAANEHGVTALHLASANAHCSVLHVLATRGADVDAVDNEGNTAMHYAAGLLDKKVKR